MAWVSAGNIRGPQGPAGVGVTYRDTLDDEDDLPTTGQQTGDMYVLIDAGTRFGAGHAVIWNGTDWDDAGPWLGPEGPKGDDGTRGTIWTVGNRDLTDLNATGIAGQIIGDLYLNNAAGANLGDVYRCTAPLP